MRVIRFFSSEDSDSIIYDWETSARAIDILRKSGTKLRIHPDIQIHGIDGGIVNMGDSVTIQKGSMLGFGDDLNGYGKLSIGTASWIGQYTNFRMAGKADIVIGKNVLIAQFCSLIAANHHTGKDVLMIEVPTDTRKCGITIGDGVWIGAGAALLPGIEIGEGAVIGANSVVTKSVPRYEIWGGVPAKKIRHRD